MAQPGRRSLWAVLTEWRNWRLPLKVGTIVLVPAVAAIVLGVVQIGGKVSSANTYGTMQQKVTLWSALIPMISGIQQERWLVAEQLGGGLNLDPTAFHQQSAAVDKAVAQVDAVAKQTLTPGTIASTRYVQLQDLPKQLTQARQLALSGGANADAVVSLYSTIIGEVLVFDQGLISQFGDATMNSQAIALYTIEVVHEQVRQQESVVSIGIARGHLVDAELTALQASEVRINDSLTEFTSANELTNDQLVNYNRTVSKADFDRREQLAQTVLTDGFGDLINGSNAGLGVSAQDWTDASNKLAGELAQVVGDLANQLSVTASSLQDAASNGAGTESVILFAVLLLAGAFGTVLGRHLLRSLGVLRRTALEVADHQLPAAVAAIEAGAPAAEVEIEPVPVYSSEELGQLARAFDAVHGQAIRSAAGQAQLRSNLRNIFVNLSRRSQSLVERQLRLMEQLERNEDNPEQLANLFKLDHLATRMRRNNENLMVLSGDDPTQRSGKPLPLPDVLRASVSEIEHYQRVVVRTTPTVELLGYAAADLVRLIAELLDNATNCSPPETQVLVGASTEPNGGVRIEIRDEGIGMSDGELRDANEKLGAGGAMEDIPVSRQMGLFVAGRLARRHGIRVSLEADQQAGGLRAIVIIPPEVVRNAAGGAQPLPAGAPVAFGGAFGSQQSGAFTPNSDGAFAAGGGPGGFGGGNVPNVNADAFHVDSYGSFGETPDFGDTSGGFGDAPGSFTAPSSFEKPPSFEPPNSFESPSSFEPPSSFESGSYGHSGSYDTPSSFDAPTSFEAPVSYEGGSYDAPTSYERTPTFEPPAPEPPLPNVTYEGADSNRPSDEDDHSLANGKTLINFRGVGDPGVPDDLSGWSGANGPLVPSENGNGSHPEHSFDLGSDPRVHSDDPEDTVIGSFEPVIPVSEEELEASTKEWGSFTGQAMPATGTDSPPAESAAADRQRYTADLFGGGEVGSVPTRAAAFDAIAESFDAVAALQFAPDTAHFEWFSLPGPSADPAPQVNHPRATMSPVSPVPPPTPQPEPEPTTSPDNDLTKAGLPRRRPSAPADPIEPSGTRSGTPSAPSAPLEPIVSAPSSLPPSSFERPQSEPPAPTPSAFTPATPATPPAPAAENGTGGDDNDMTKAGLPRRVPRARITPNLLEPPPAPSGGPAGAAAAANANRNPGRSRGFLSEYQAGVRQGKHSRPDEPTDNAFGQETR